MRVLLIRHAENDMNMMMARFEVEHSRRTLDPKDAEGSLRDFDLDAPLTEVGFAQADALGQYWAPLLQPYDESGRLHLYVSPSIRTLQTLAPLASRLTTTPIVKPEITECPGMMRGTDRTKVWPRIHRAEMNEDWATVAKIDAEMEGKWLRSGLTRSQINDRFPGYALDESFVDDEPWYAYGAESTPVRRRRLGAVNQWLIEMSNTLPADHLVVLVTHSNAIRIMLHGLMFNFDDSKHVNMCDNTSVSSILFQTTQPPTQPPKRRPLWSRMAKSTDICFEFYNRVDHLVAVHEMDRLSGILAGKTPEHHHYDNDPHHDAFMANVHEASKFSNGKAARKLVSKL
eukprot:m.130922 g.130922  ORF g.130922 m.130922 type:complete len:343 (-) comp22392_c0_seq2:178-1206(-)